MMDWAGCASRRLLFILMYYSKHYPVGIEKRQTVPIKTACLWKEMAV
jgi:hypothetical protein